MSIERKLKIAEHLFQDIYSEIKPIIEKGFSEYKPAKYYGYIIQDLDTIDEKHLSHSNEICDKCADELVEELRRKFPTKTFDIEYQNLSDLESSTFECCDKCNKYFEQMHSELELELEYYLEPDINPNDIDPNEPENAWILHQIFENDYDCYLDDDELIDIYHKLTKLVEKVSHLIVHEEQ